MPAISMFFGIGLSVIPAKAGIWGFLDSRLRGNDGERALLAGSLPIAKVRLVQAWIEIHRESLMADWEPAINGEAPFPIDPLR